MCIRVVSLLFILSCPVGAAIISVPNDFSTLQLAIDAASSGDTVVVEPGIYQGTGNRDLVLQNKSILLRSSGGPSATIIDCQGSASDPHRALSVYAGPDSNSVIEGFTILNGYAGSGGAIWLDSAVAPMLRGCWIAQCQAVEGGAIFSRHWSTLSLDSCTIRHNSAVRGGALFGRMLTLRMNECSMDSNHADTGGAISAYQIKVHLKKCAFNANVASIWGGAVCLEDTYLACDSSSFTNNSATPLESNEFVSSGGAIRAVQADRYFATSGPSYLRDCVFVNDSAAYGGAVVLGMDTSVAIQISGCTFIQNVATRRGGGLHVGSSVLVDSCLFSENRALYGLNSWNGGGAIFSFGERSEPLIRDSWFDRNYTPGYGGAVHFDLTGGSLVQRCTFTGNIADSAGSAIAVDYSDTVNIEYSLFASNVGVSLWAMWGADPHISHCTFYGTQLGGRANAQIGAYGNCNVDLRHSIVSHGQARAFTTMSGSVLNFKHNDIFANAEGDYLGLPADSNFSVDPLYCDTLLDDFGLDSRSPCTPGMRPDHALIGALQANCSCCEGVTGNISMSGTVDLTDLSVLISFLTATPPPTLSCPEEANVDWMAGIDLSDLSMLIAYITTPGVELPSCR